LSWSNPLGKEELIELYFAAIDLHLEQEFIALLLREIQFRKINLTDRTSTEESN